MSEEVVKLTYQSTIVLYKIILAHICAIRLIAVNLSPASLTGRRPPIELINAILNKETGEIMEYRQIMKSPTYRKFYKKIHRKELGRLTQGIPVVVKGTNTKCVIDKEDMPVKRWQDVTYGRGVVDYRSEQSDLYQMHLIVGGNLIVYPSNSDTVRMLKF